MTYEITISGQSRAKIRSPWTAALLYVFTLGFYGIYWWYEVNREMRDVGRERREDLGDNPGLSAAAYFFGSCLVVPYVWTVVTTSRRVERTRALLAPEHRAPMVVAVLLFLLGVAAAVPFFFTASGGAALGSLLAALALTAAAIAYLQSALNASWRGLARERETAPETGPAPEAA